MNEIFRSISNCHFFQDRSNLSRACKTNSTSQIIAHDSAIGQHLLENPLASQYIDTKLSILARGRTSFHLFRFCNYVYQIFSTQSLSRQQISLQFKTQSLTLFYFAFNWLPLLTNQMHTRFLFFSIHECSTFLINQTPPFFPT